jgi:hypothetical protein
MANADARFSHGWVMSVLTPYHLLDYTLCSLQKYTKPIL